MPCESVSVRLAFGQFGNGSAGRGRCGEVFLPVLMNVEILVDRRDHLRLLQRHCLDWQQFHYCYNLN